MAGAPPRRPGEPYEQVPPITEFHTWLYHDLEDDTVVIHRTPCLYLPDMPGPRKMVMRGPGKWYGPYNSPTDYSKLETKVLELVESLSRIKYSCQFCGKLPT